MTAEAWKNAIEECCRQAGTYQQYFDNVIISLAEILERKDAAMKQFKDQGEQFTVEYTNKAGATNMIPNPLFKIIQDLDKDALTYWRELGLTPLRLKRIFSNGLIQGSGSSLADLLKKLEED